MYVAQIISFNYARIIVVQISQIELFIDHLGFKQMSIYWKELTKIISPARKSFFGGSSTVKIAR